MNWYALGPIIAAGAPLLQKIILFGLYGELKVLWELQQVRPFDSAQGRLSGRLSRRGRRSYRRLFSLGSMVN